MDHRDQTVASIAHACGFGGDGNFFRAFRVETGQSPADFRERAPADRSGLG
ncbi:helix-turn-helix domain-containing protein [Nocardia cyriacigeorgica]|uniref:helix-turn-helix domain-containing protein n=1 Tax=Nocardia cyriacigeorgica TaxID=135487 RepID=UPI00138B061F|nr:AraC family transcriptional regulator [Nocardia cyriacigeorgica]